MSSHDRQIVERITGHKKSSLNWIRFNQCSTKCEYVVFFCNEHIATAAAVIELNWKTDLNYNSKGNNDWFLGEKNIEVEKSVKPTNWCILDLITQQISRLVLI